MLSAEDIVRLDGLLRVSEIEFEVAGARTRRDLEWIPENRAEKILLARQLLGLRNTTRRATEKEGDE